MARPRDARCSSAALLAEASAPFLDLSCACRLGVIKWAREAELGQMRSKGGRRDVRQGRCLHSNGLGERGLAQRLLC